MTRGALIRIFWWLGVGLTLAGLPMPPQWWPTYIVLGCAFTCIVIGGWMDIFGDPTP